MWIAVLVLRECGKDMFGGDGCALGASFRGRGW